MPLSTSLPAQAVEFYTDLQYPITGQGQTEFASIPAANFSRSRNGFMQTAEPFCAPFGFDTGAGLVGPRIETIGGRPCCRLSTTINRHSQGWVPLQWQPGWDAAGFNPGSILDPGSVVATIDWTCAMFQAAHVAPDDVTGFWFMPALAARSFTFGTPNGGTPAGGFGIFANDDGAGGNQWEFVTSDANAYPGNVLLRVPIGAAIVPDVTVFNFFRFTIISAASGRAATVSLEVNGQAIAGATALPFDDITLFRPLTLSAQAPNYAFGSVLAAMGGVGFRYTLYCRFGRFTASGTQLQAI